MKALARAACLLASLLTLGCGTKSSIDRVTVEGNVTYNGSPITNGQIQFYPIEGTPGPVASSPIVAGKYSVVNKGGVPIGKHRVVIEGYQPPPPNSDEDAGSVQYLPEKFNRQSTLTSDIPAGESVVVRDFPLSS
jgi:hypothetical protein